MQRSLRWRLSILAVALYSVSVASSTAYADDFGSQGTPGLNGNGVWLIPTSNWDVARRALTAPITLECKQVSTHPTFRRP